MKTKKLPLSNRTQRPILSDVLPFEVPASFSNRHYFDLIAKFNMRIDGNSISWHCEDDRMDVFVRLLSGTDDSSPIETKKISRFGREVSIRRIDDISDQLITMPFHFDISHKGNSARRLAVPHPLNQLAVADFYNKHADTIIYFAEQSEFSIRKPAEVARFSNFKDRLHEKLLQKGSTNIEEFGREYNQLGSFFVYKQYSNIFKFFEHYRYHRAEKRFNAMAQIDVSKCFDSIYTHSLPWAIHGKQAVKDNLKDSKSTFAGDFDSLLSKLNQNETNGIIIGPEFSRVFAELILQSVDVRLQKRLKEIHGLRHKADYRIFRYVDDYFIFYDKAAQLETISENLQFFLSEVKLHINEAKTIIYEKPIITAITIAKNQIAPLLSEHLRAENRTIEPEAIDKPQASTDLDKSLPDPTSFHCQIDSNRLIIGYKSILKTTGVSYLEVSNYTFSIIEGKVDQIISAYLRSDAQHRSEAKLTRCLTNLIEFTFFLYASSPRVNLSIRLARTISIIAKALRGLAINREYKHQFLKYVYDNATEQLKKNRALEFKEIENLYLLTALREMGRDYWIDEEVLRLHIGIDIDKNGEYILKNGQFLGYFSITVCLLYMGEKAKYSKLRHFVETQAIEKIEARREYRYKDTEVLMLALDMLAYPYLTAAAKVRIQAVYQLDAAKLAELSALSRNWFTTWERASLLEELDAKRSRDVY